MFDQWAVSRCFWCLGHAVFVLPMGPKGSQLPPPLRPPPSLKDAYKKGIGIFFWSQGFHDQKTMNMCYSGDWCHPRRKCRKSASLHSVMVPVPYPYCWWKKSGDHHLGCFWNPVNKRIFYHMSVSENSGTPKSSILIGFSLINHPFWGTPIFGNPHINWCRISEPSTVLFKISTWFNKGLQDGFQNAATPNLYIQKNGVFQITSSIH